MNRIYDNDVGRQACRTATASDRFMNGDIAGPGPVLASGMRRRRELRQLIENGPVFDGDTVLVDHAVIIDDSRIVELVPANQGTSAISVHRDLQGNMLAPGFIDIQVNGGGGILFNDAHMVRQDCIAIEYRTIYD